MIFSIVGQFENLNPNETVYFGGFFVENTDGKIEGFLSDKYGASTIEGKRVNARTYEFTKKYFPGYGHRTSISYKITKDRRVWKGTYRFSGDEKGRLDGEVVCQLFSASFQC